MTPDLQHISETPAITTEHLHGWLSESRHRSLDGDIVYQRCVDCGARRVDLEHRGEEPPSPLSTVIDPAHNEHRASKK